MAVRLLMGRTFLLFWEVVMFVRIGSKIKGLASVITWLGIIASCISGFALIGNSKEMIPLGISVMFIGSLASWISSFLLYGFGELIEKTCIIADRLSLHPQMQSVQDTHNAELDDLLRKGVISNDEYQEIYKHE